MGTPKGEDAFDDGESEGEAKGCKEEEGGMGGGLRVYARDKAFEILGCIFLVCMFKVLRMGFEMVGFREEEGEDKSQGDDEGRDEIEVREGEGESVYEKGTCGGS